MESSKHIGWGWLLVGVLGSGVASAWATSMNTLTQELADTQAWREKAYWRVAMAPHTEHYRPSAEHQSVWAVALDRQRRDGWLAGASRFSNSFGQPSAYVYLGEKVINFSRWDKLFFQWTAGILYGYKYPYEDKVPFNVNGFSPGVTVGLGWQFTREFSVQAIALGTAGMMFQFAIDLR